MKLKDSITKEDILKVGFTPIKEGDYDEEDYPLSVSDYAITIGYSRRGQFYYLLIKDRVISIYASNPDGSGGSIVFPLELINIIHFLTDVDSVD